MGNPNLSVDILDTPVSEACSHYLPEEGAHNPYSSDGFITPTNDEVVFTDADDIHKWNQKMKQIQYGKETAGYLTYRRCIPLHKRIEGNVHHPVTPRADDTTPKRKWDRELRAWRRALHHWNQFNNDY